MLCAAGLSDETAGLGGRAFSVKEENDMAVLDQTIPYYRYFEHMTRIPHGSRNEKAYSDFLVSWAEEHGLECLQDEMYNVVVCKPASEGYESHPPVILQGHIDMVCAKTADSSHDFTRDPLSLYIEDGFLRAKNTTLGADDGVGAAYMLSVLESDSLKHPPLECVFTVQEEVGCRGAAALKKEYFKAKRMIGLDDVGGGTTYVSAAGSQNIVFSRKISRETSALPAYRLEISGLRSGHSGVDIDKERGNAIKLAARLLYELQKKGKILISDMQFGTADNVIPGHGTAVFAAGISYETITEETERMKNIFAKELEYSDPDLKMTLVPTEAESVLTESDSRDLITFFRFLPNGFRHKSIRFPGLTTASCNIGTIHLNEESMTAEECIRGAVGSYIDDMEEEQIRLCELYGIDRKVTGRVAPFDYAEHSPIRNALAEVFREVTGRDLQPVFVHGGIEAGYFKLMYPEMDIVTIGPLVIDEHMPSERLSLESFDEIWKVLTRLLETL